MQVAVGLLLVLPAAFALLVSYVWPTLRTGWFSLQERHIVGGDPEFVGLDNYRRLDAGLVAEPVTNLDPGRFGGSLTYALSFAIVPLAVLVVVAPLLAWAAHQAGRPGRWTARLGFTVPIVCFAPVALAVAWQVDRGDLLGNPVTAPASLRAAAWLTTIGLVCGLGVTLYLAALRRRETAELAQPGLTGPPGQPGQPAPPGQSGGSRLAAVGAVAGLAVLTVLALALQTTTFPFVLTGGGPDNSTLTPMVDIFRTAFQQANVGLGAARSMVLLIPLLLIGIGAALVMIVTGLRIEVDPPDRPAAGPPSRAGTRVIALVAAAAGTVAVLAIALYGLWPWLSRIGGFGPVGDASTMASVLLNTWLPPVVSTVVGVGLAAVAGFGIGGLRPLGRWSELLLLPFSPWLFVGIGPLAVVKYEALASGPFDRLDTIAGLVPPVWLVVPALFVFTLLFRGLAGRRRDRAATGTDPGRGSVLWPALPMLALIAAATWLVQSQALVWGVLVARSELTAPVWLTRAIAQQGFAHDAAGFGLILPIPVIVIFAAGLGALQLLYLDRLAIRVGRQD